MKAVFKSEIEETPAIIDLLPGGVHTKNEITRQLTAAAFDANGVIRPCMLIKEESDNPTGPKAAFSNTFFSFYIYEPGNDTAVVDQVIPLVKAKYHDQQTSGSNGVFNIRYVTVVKSEDIVLNCTVALIRFVVVKKH